MLKQETNLNPKSNLSYHQQYYLDDKETSSRKTEEWLNDEETVNLRKKILAEIMGTCQRLLEFNKDNLQYHQGYVYALELVLKDVSKETDDD